MTGAIAAALDGPPALTPRTDGDRGLPAGVFNVVTLHPARGR
jgi:hypothetical protein